MTNGYYELRRLSFVNWYLFDAEDIDVEGSIALVGGNGAGKSSILDAVQTVLTGNHNRYLELNFAAQKAVRTGRTVRSYCLGVLDDVPDAIDGLRDESISYLMLGFVHTVSGEAVTIGMCFEARRDDPDIHVRARFVAKGAHLSSADVSTKIVDGDDEFIEALPWSTAKAALESAGVQLGVYSQPLRFIQEYAAAMKTQDGPMDANRFLRSLRNTITFKEASNPDEFIRKNVVNAERVDVSGMKQSSLRYQELMDVIRGLQARVEAIRTVKDKFDDMASRRGTAMRQEYLSGVASVLLLERQKEKAATELSQWKSDLMRSDARVAESEERRDAARQAEIAIITRMNQSDAMVRRQMAEQQVSMLEGEIKNERQSLAPIVTLIARAREAEHLIGGLNAGMAAELGALPGNPASLSAHEIGEALSRFRERDLEAALDKARRAASSSQRDLDEVEARIAELREGLDRVAVGKSPIGGDTRALLEYLSSRGISATPLCELVESVEDGWRDAAEAVLGDAAEALIVAPEDYEAAFEAFRRSGLTRGSIVNTSKTHQTRPPAPNSLALCLTVSDVHARAFVDYRLGGIVLVSTAAEAKREDSAITQDLMYSSGRTTRRLSRRSPRLGVAGRASTIAEEISREIAELEAGARSHRMRMKNEELVVARVQDLISRLEEARAIDSAAVSSRLAALRDQISALKTEIADYDSENQDFARQRDAAKALLARAEADLTRAAGDRSTLEERITNTERRINELQMQIGNARAQVDDVLERCAAYLNEADTAKYWNAQVSELTYERAVGLTFDEEVMNSEVRRLSERKSANMNIANNLFSAVRLQLQHYFVDHKLPLLDELRADDVLVETVGEWIYGELSRIEGNELLSYQEKAREILETVKTQVFRDYAAKMDDAREGIKDDLRALNRRLERTPFHGLKFKFAYRENPAKKSLIALIDAADEFLNEGTLWGDKAMLDQRRADALAWIEQYLSDPNASLEDINDPRDLYLYDIEMKGDDERVQTDLTTRLGTSSGGQVQAPFYVALAAGIKSAAYPGRSEGDGAVPLALFDEAFGKMDDFNILNCIDFMRDTGLQVFLAAPDNKRIGFSQMVRTVVSIARSGDRCSLDVQYIEPKAHEAFRAANPRLKTLEQFKEGFETADAA